MARDHRLPPVLCLKHKDMPRQRTKRWRKGRNRRHPRRRPGARWPWIVPSWARVIERTMDRPRPAPPPCLIRSAVSRRNGSNSEDTSSAVTCWPLLRTTRAGAPATRDLDPAAWLVVADRVGHQVADQPLQQHRVAGHDPLVQRVPQRDHVLGGQFLMCLQHRGSQFVQPDRHLALQAAVAFRERQHALDQLLVVLVGAQQLGTEPAQVLARVRVVQRHLGQQALNGQRGAQLGEAFAANSR